MKKPLPENKFREQSKASSYTSVIPVGWAMGVNFVTTDLITSARSFAAVYSGAGPYKNQSKNTVEPLYSGYDREPLCPV